MSTGTPRNFTPDQPPTTSTVSVQTILGYITPILALIGLFVLMGVGKLDTNVGIPLVAAIVGVHGGAAITNQSNTP